MLCHLIDLTLLLFVTKSICKECHPVLNPTLLPYFVWLGYVEADLVHISSLSQSVTSEFEKVLEYAVPV